MKIVFFGTSKFAAEVLSYLYRQNYPILAVVTRPDRPQGRSLAVFPPPVKQTAAHLGPALPIYQPERASTAEFASILASLNADLFVVVAFGEIIKENILSIPPFGCVNIHASLLPKYRGAAPIQRCLMNGEKETGITTIEMVLKMDAGDILVQSKIAIDENMLFGELEKELCDLACTTIVKTIQQLKNGTLQRIAQDETLVTYAPKIMPEELKIHWDAPAKKVHDQIRALSPSPGAWCLIKVGEEEKKLKIKRTVIVEQCSGEPGSIARFEKGEWIVACQSQALQLLEVQLEGKKTMSAAEFMRGISQELTIKI